MSLPRYYDNVLQVEDEIDMMDRKRKRKQNINKEDQTLERLKVKEICMKSKTQTLKRNLEEI